MHPSIELPKFTTHEIRVEVGHAEVVDGDQAIRDANRVDRDGSALRVDQTVIQCQLACWNKAFHRSDVERMLGGGGDDLALDYANGVLRRPTQPSHSTFGVQRPDAR